MMIKALIFDFDGLILDTETPRYSAWSETYLRFNCNLSILEYALIVGSDDKSFDFYGDLEKKYGNKIQWENINQTRRKRNSYLLSQEKALPGVQEYIFEGKSMGLKIALASSSPMSWIDEHLSRIGFKNYFDCITTIDETGIAKPEPALFNLTIEKLQIKQNEVIVFEDSPNGCKAAQNAEMFCVAVLNNITRHLTFDKPDLIINSMCEVSLNEIIKKAEQKIA